MINAVLTLHETGLDFRVLVIGLKFHEQPRVFAEVHSGLTDNYGDCGMVAADAD